MNNLHSVDDTNPNTNLPKTPPQEEKQNINTTDNDNFDYLASFTQNQSQKNLHQRRYSFSGSLKPLIDKDQKSKSKYYSDDPNTDKPSLAEGEKPESKSLISSQPSKANSSSVSNEKQRQDTQIEQMGRNFETEVGNLDREIEKLGKNLNSLSKKIEKLNSEAKTLQTETESSKTEAEKAEASIENLLTKLGELDRKAGKLQAEIENVQKEIKEFDAKRSELDPKLDWLDSEIEKETQSIETEIEETKSKTTKTVVGLAASGLAISGAAVACLILLPALPIYACGLLGAAIGAAIGLLIFAIIRGMSGKAKRKDLERKLLRPNERSRKISEESRKSQALQDQQNSCENLLNTIQNKHKDISELINSLQQLPLLESKLDDWQKEIDKWLMPPEGLDSKVLDQLFRILQIAVVHREWGTIKPYPKPGSQIRELLSSYPKLMLKPEETMSNFRLGRNGLKYDDETSSTAPKVESGPDGNTKDIQLAPLQSVGLLQLNQLIALGNPKLVENLEWSFLDSSGGKVWTSMANKDILKEELEKLYEICQQQRQEFSNVRQILANAVKLQIKSFKTIQNDYWKYAQAICAIFSNDQVWNELSEEVHTKLLQFAKKVIRLVYQQWNQALQLVDFAFLFSNVSLKATNGVWFGLSNTISYAWWEIPQNKTIQQINKLQKILSTKFNEVDTQPVQQDVTELNAEDFEEMFKARSKSIVEFLNHDPES